MTQGTDPEQKNESKTELPLIVVVPLIIAAAPIIYVLGVAGKVAKVALPAMEWVDRKLKGL